MQCRMLFAFIAIGVFFVAMVATANADFVFTKPAGAVTFTTVGEKTVVEIENKGAATATPTLRELQKNNMNGAGEQHIIVNNVKTLKECEVGIVAGGKCSVEVEYKVKREAAEPIAEFKLTVEPPNLPCPNMSPKFTA